MGAKRKLRNRILHDMMDGRISVDQARHLLGLPRLRAPREAGAGYRAPQHAGSAFKSAGGAGQPARAGVSAPPRSSLERMAESFADPLAREAARTYGYNLDGGARSWAPPLPGLVREAEGNPDPREREGARAAIQKSMAGRGSAPATSARMVAWGTGPDGGAEWQLPSEPVIPGLQIAVPGVAGR